MRSKGVEVLICEEKENKVSLSDLIDKLSKQGIDSILLEGGGKLNFSAINEDVVNKVYSFIAPKLIGGEKAKTPVGGVGFENMDQSVTLEIKDIKRFDQDILVEANIKKT